MKIKLNALNIYFYFYFCSWQNKSQSINKIKTRTTTIETTASVQYKGHGTHAMEPETPYKASAPKKNITNVSKRTLLNIYRPTGVVQHCVSALQAVLQTQKFKTNLPEALKSTGSPVFGWLQHQRGRRPST